MNQAIPNHNLSKQKNINQTRVIIVAITGATGIIYAIKLLELLSKDTTIEKHLIISDAAKLTLKQESQLSLRQLKAMADIVHDNADIGATIASGSFKVSAMVVIPCSIKSLSGIVNSYASDLISRSADVCLKEQRKLILAVRETPFHQGHLELMLRASQYGALIMPLAPAFYFNPQTINDLIEHLVSRIADHLNINYNHQIAQPWTGIKQQLREKNEQKKA